MRVKRFKVFSCLLAMAFLFVACSRSQQTPDVSSQAATSAVQEDSSILYPPEQPAYDSEVPFENVSNNTVEDVFEALDGSSSKASSSQQQSAAASSKASSFSKSSSSKASSAAASSKAASSKPSTEQAPSQSVKAPSGEMRAVWLSYLDLETILKSKSQSEAKAGIDKAFDKIAAQSMNTVIVQVRPFADALYDSQYFPWSKILTGTQGKNPGYDPLSLMVSAAHKRGLEIHAWVNPYRVLTTTDMSKLSDDNIAKQWYEDEEDYTIVVDSKGIFFNPARPEVRKLIVNGIKELVSGYDIDGVHFDDYFYPTTASSFDKTAYDEYKADGGALSLAGWRLDNVNKLISDTYSAVKAINSSVQFGVSPQANVDINYSSQYADVKTWCKTPGYIDYIMPQVYFGFENDTCPYEDTVELWNSMIKASGVKLYTGLAVYKIGVSDQWAGAGADEWQDTTTMLERQVSAARELSKYSGFALYRYDSIFNPASSVKTSVNEELENLQSIL